MLGLAAHVAPAWAETYGAIAYSEQTGEDAWAFDTVSADGAGQRALSSCAQKGGGCKVVTSFSNACAALAVGVNNRFAASQAINKQQAESEALNACRIGGGTNCNIRVGFCTNPPNLFAEPGLWQLTSRNASDGQTQPASSATHCIKPNDVAADNWVVLLDPAASDPTCNRTDLHESSNSIEWKFVCGGPASWSRQGSIRFDSSRHYNGTISTRGKIAGNPSQGDVLRADGKWIGPCTGGAN